MSIPSLHLAVWGIKQKFQIFFHSPGLAVGDVAVRKGLEDVRSLVQYQSVELNYYSVSWTQEYRVFTAYTALYDWMNRKNGYAALSVFVPLGKRIVGGSGPLLEQLMRRYRDEYVGADYKIKQIPEQPEPFFQMVNDAELVDDPQLRPSRNRRALGVVRFPKEGVGTFLESLHQEEYAGYEKVFFLPAGQRRINGSPKLRVIAVKDGQPLDPLSGSTADRERPSQPEKSGDRATSAPLPPPAPASAPKAPPFEPKKPSISEETFRMAPPPEKKNRGRKVSPPPVPAKPRSGFSPPTDSSEPLAKRKRAEGAKPNKTTGQGKRRPVDTEIQLGRSKSDRQKSDKPANSRGWWLAGAVVLLLGFFGLRSLTSGPSAAEIAVRERLERLQQDSIDAAAERMAEERRENQIADEARMAKLNKTQEVIFFANADQLHQTPMYEENLALFTSADQLTFSSLTQRSAIKARIETMAEIARANYLARQTGSEKEGLEKLGQLVNSDKISTTQQTLVKGLIENYQKQEKERKEKQEQDKKKAAQARLDALLEAEAKAKDRRKQAAATGQGKSRATKDLMTKANAVTLYNEVTYDALEAQIKNNDELSYGEKFTLGARLQAMRKVKSLMDGISFGDRPSEKVVQKLAENPSLTKAQKIYILNLSDPKK